MAWQSECIWGFAKISDPKISPPPSAGERNVDWYRSSHNLSIQPSTSESTSVKDWGIARSWAWGPDLSYYFALNAATRSQTATIQPQPLHSALPCPPNTKEHFPYHQGASCHLVSTSSTFFWSAPGVFKLRGRLLQTQMLTRSLQAFNGTMSINTELWCPTNHLVPPSSANSISTAYLHIIERHKKDWRTGLWSQKMVMAWQPQQEPLGQLSGCLKDSLSGHNKTAQKQAEIVCGTWKILYFPRLLIQREPIYWFCGNSSRCLLKQNPLPISTTISRTYFQVHKFPLDWAIPLKNTMQSGRQQL